MDSRRILHSHEKADARSRAVTGAYAISSVMVDSRLRRAERAAGNDAASAAQLISARLRAGLLPETYVQLAAHLGHGPAKLVVGDGGYWIDCGCEGANPSCYSCNGHGKRKIGHGLRTAIVQSSPRIIPSELIGRWAIECVRHALNQNASYQYLDDRVIEHVERWLGTGNVTVELSQLQADATGQRRSDYFVNACSKLVLATRFDGYASVSNFCDAVSNAYHATGHTRAERKWQISALVRHLLYPR